jgi:hypothetical protein
MAHRDAAGGAIHTIIKGVLRLKRAMIGVVACSYRVGCI